MLSWIVRGLLAAGGFFAAWIVARDNPNFELVQMAIATIILAAVLALVAFWPRIWRR